MADPQGSPGKPTDTGTAPPRGWTVTDRPLRIALLGWARLALQGSQGSGYNLSASELAAGLALSGHEVFYLAGGRRYSLWPWAHVAPTETWRGIRCYDLVNSPNLSPAAHNFRNMPREMRDPASSRCVVRWLDAVRAEVVHVHSLEGFPLDLIPAIRASGRPVIVTPHNYWYCCPQVDLMHEESRICHDYDGGRRCVGCLDAPVPWRSRLKRRVDQAFSGITGFQVATAAKNAVGSARERLRDFFDAAQTPLPNSRPPDPEAARGFDASGGDGLVRHNFENDDEHLIPVDPAPLDANERFLRQPHHLHVLNDYGRRRAAGMDALNAATLVTPPSDYVRRVYIAMGLDESRTRVVRLGQPHFDQINRRARRSPFYGARPWDPATATRPLRFTFFGTMRPSKGIDVLARAVPLIPRDARRRCQIQVRVSGWDWPYRKLLSPYPEVSFLGGYDLVQLVNAGGEYEVGILPHAWFENSPLVLLEHFHAGKPVVCSRLGGPPEWVVTPDDARARGLPNHNGLLFAGGHPQELADCITGFISGRTAIPSPREVHEVTPNLQSYPGHVAQIESIYREALHPPGAGAAAPQPALAATL